MKRVITLVGLIALAEVGFAAVTTRISLDCREGARMASETEKIAFSPTWETAVDGAEAVISINGIEVSRSAETGIYEWIPTEGGLYTFTHVVMAGGSQAGETLSAYFSVWNNIDLVLDSDGVVTGLKDNTVDTVTIPAGITGIAADAFKGAINLTHLIVESFDWANDGISDKTFADCRIAELTLQESAGKVPGFIFKAIPTIEKINVPSKEWWLENAPMSDNSVAKGTALLYVAGEKIDMYYIEYDANGGEGEMSHSYMSNNGVTVSECSFIRESRTFEGWSLEREGSATILPSRVFSLEDFDGEEKITLHAIWDVGITSVAANQRHPFDGKVDIEIRLAGAEEDLADCECVFSAKNTENDSAIAIENIKRVSVDTPANGAFIWRYEWDALEDVGEVVIESLAIDVEIKRGGVQLWEGGPYWAESNVGAENPEDYGYYFWWGDTVGYSCEGGRWTDGYYYSGVTWVSSTGVRTSESPFSSEKCLTNNKSISQLQAEGYVDRFGNLTSAHDAASVHCGIHWRMPTIAELEALTTNCDTAWTTRNGVYGRLVTGRGAFSSKSIFLPAAGNGNSSGLDQPGARGLYRSSTPDQDDPGCAWALFFNSGRTSLNYYNYREYGRSVRPVRDVSNATICSKSAKLEWVGMLSTYSITYYDLKGAKHTNPASYQEGSTVEFSDPSAAEGYAFIGWEPAAITADMVGNVTVRATWQANNYRISYDANGGLGEMANTNASYDQNVILSANEFTRLGYEFSGWALTPDGEVVYGNLETVRNLTSSSDSSVILYAVWLREISDFMPEAVLAVSNDDSYPWTAEFSAPDWTLQSGKVGKSGESSLSIEFEGAAKLVYSRKTSCEDVDVSGDRTDGLLVTVDGEEVDFSSGITEWEEKCIDLRKDGHHVLTWTYFKDRRTDEGDDCAWVKEINVIPYHSVSFMCDDEVLGDGLETMFVLSGLAFEIPGCAGLAKPKHRFIGWRIESEIYPAGLSMDMESNDITAYAVWEAKLLAKPSIEVPSVYDAQSVEVVISSEDADATILYAIDDGEYAHYSAPVLIEGSHTVYAYCTKDDYFDSDVASVYTLRLPQNASECLGGDGITYNAVGEYGWVRDLNVSHDGQASMKSAAIEDKKFSSISAIIEGPGELSFWTRVSSEADEEDGFAYDGLMLYLDGQRQWNECLGGDVEWGYHALRIEGAGSHIITWSYEKDKTGSSGEDCAWLDDVVWTPRPPRPEALESASDDVKAAFDKWIADNGVANPSAVNVNAFVLGLKPTASEEEIQDQVEKELGNLDLGKLTEGDVSAAVEAIQDKYPNAKVELKPVENITTSAHLYKLVIDIK